MNDLTELTKFATLYAKAWCSQNPESVAAFYAENSSLSVNDGPPAVGRAAIAEVARGFMRTFPDMIVTMDDVSRNSSGTKFHWTLTGTNNGLGGTGKRVRITGYELWKIDNGAGGSRATWTGKPERVDEQGGESINDGLIAESKGHFDSAEYERQLKHGVDASFISKHQSIC
jgi:predicted ester cyclase